MPDSVPPIGAFDAFRNVESWDAEQARYWTDGLNKRAAAPDQVALRAFIIQQSGLKPGDTALELGCGTGRLLAELAAVAGVSGQVFGLEPQAAFVREAEQLITEQKLSSIAHVLTGHAEEIPLPDASVDVCLAQTVLIHIPPAVLPQVWAGVKRVLKPGGKFLSVDQDGDTWVIDHPNRAVTRKIVQFNSDYRYADGWTGRYLRRWLRQNGFQNVQVQAWPHADTDRDSYLYQMAQRIAQAAVEHNVLTPDECQQWLDDLDRQAQEGNFFSSICYYCGQGRRVE